MIKIENNQFYFNGIETTNPELIGLAILDFIDNGGTEIPEKKNTAKNKEISKNKYFSYLSQNKLSITRERKLLIDLFLGINDFEPIELIKKALEIKITPATCYNFIQTCVDAEILEIQPKKYIFK